MTKDDAERHSGDVRSAGTDGEASETAVAGAVIVREREGKSEAKGGCSIGITGFEGDRSAREACVGAQFDRRRSAGEDVLNC